MKKHLSLLLALTLALGLVGSALATDLTMGTAATSGTYYYVGAAIGNTVSKLSDDLEVLVISTAGGVENIGLVSKNEIQIGMANSDALYDASNGTGTFEAVGKMPIKGLMALYPSVSHMMVRADSGIKAWSDLKGKKVCLGTAGSSHTVASKALLRLYGIDWEKDITASYLTTGEMCTMLSDGDIDAAFLVGGAPVSGVTNACATAQLDLLDIDDGVMDAMIAELPYFSKSTIPAGTYPGIDHDVNAVALKTCFFVNADMSEEAAYQFVKTAMENTADFVEANASCRYITPQTVVELPLDIHPGALKYYREAGLID